MSRISHKKVIVTALAAGSLGVLGAAGAAHAATNPVPSRSTTNTSSAPASPGATGTGAAATGSTGADQSDGPGDQAESGAEVKDAPEVKGADTDNVQQGDQSGPDTPGSVQNQ